MSTVRTILKAVIPASLDLPLRYYRMKAAGRLDYELSVLASHIRNTERAIDVGANIGFYSYALSKICKWVESFEPLIACTPMLKAYARNGRIRVHDVALSNTIGEATIHVPVAADGFVLTGFASLNRADNAQQFTVPLRRLDDYAFNDVGFIKIDVEGHEFEVLEGAVETIQRWHPTLFVEIEQRHLTKRRMSDVFGLIRSLGYLGSFYSAGVRHDLSEFSYETHQAPFLGNVFDGRYVNNFLFKHSEDEKTST
jgi:FkbM family methyltransferase